jgi:flagellar basal-body rod protein FlgF
MDKGIYTALSGGMARAHEVELLANNLANVNTPGFKRDTGTFNEYLTELRRPDSVEGLKREIENAALGGRVAGDKSFVEMDGVYTDFKQGALQKTSRGLDVALEGKGFFEVLTPAGIRYTRQGNFTLDGEGRLVNGAGHYVLARDPRLTQPLTGRFEPTAPEARVIQMGRIGPAEITPDARILQGGAELAQLSLVEFHEPQWLEKMGHGLWKNTHEDNLRHLPPESQVHQGFLEGSNVNPVHEMTKLIEATRAYESQLQAIKTYGEIDSRSVNDIARSR